MKNLRRQRGRLGRLECGIHGSKYFVFKRVGPCMHPDCAVSRLETWSKLDPIAAQAFAPVRNYFYDLVVWGMTDGEKYLCYRWDEKEAWMKAVSHYLRLRRIEKAKTASAVEAEKLTYIIHARGSNGTGSNAGKTIYPDSNLWVRECCNYITKQFGDAMTAYLLDIIDLFDLAKLCYSGDIIKTKEAVAFARSDLKRWCFG